MKNKDYNKYRKYGYPAFWVILYLIFFLINPLEQSFRDWQRYTLWKFFEELLYAFIFAALVFESGIQITLLLNKPLPWEAAPRKRMLVQLILQVVAVVIIFSTLFFLPLFDEEMVDWLIFRQALVLGILFSILSTAIFTAEYFFRSYIATKLATAQYQQQASQAALEALKSHIDPHFMFNNFSILSSLIEEDGPAAVAYVAELSKVYRYVLNTKDRETVPLQDELDFINRYYHLYQIRFADAIHLHINIGAAAAGRRICPMTLQLLFENAVKHNIVSVEKPLTITLLAEQSDVLVVSNNLQPKQTQEVGNGIGLQSIRERYALLGSGLPVVEKSDTHFTVKIPLL